MDPAIGEQILRGTHRLEPMPGGETTSLLSQRFLAGDEETLLFLFLEILRRVNKSTPSTPSGMIPPAPKGLGPTREVPGRRRLSREGPLPLMKETSVVSC